MFKSAHHMPNSSAYMKPKAPKPLSIANAIKKPGALHKQLGVPMDKKIPKAKLNAAAKAPGKLGQRARFAKELDSFN